MAATRLAWALWTLVFAVQTAFVVMYAMAGTTEDASSVASGVVAFLVFQLFATVGAVVASRRPGNPIGWLFCLAPLLTAMANASGGYIDLALERGLGGAVAVSVAFGWTWLAALGVMVVIALLFPDGRLPSPRWRPLGLLAVVWLPAVALTFAFKAGPLESPLEGIDNPVGVPGLGAAFDVLSTTGGAVLLIAALVSLVLRFHRNPEQRQQIKWFLASVGFALTVIVAFSIADALSTSFNGPPDSVFLLALGTIPVATGVAILKYRLYEIDRIVNRTVVYGAVSALLAALYFGLVVVLQQVFSGFAGGSDLAIAGSTLAVAALFRPARRRIQELVDRRFYRRRYDTHQTLEAFSAHLRDEVALDALSAELRSVVQRTMQPAHVSLWLREPANGSVTPAVTIPERPGGRKDSR
jgi:hypothetical protein